MPAEFAELLRQIQTQSWLACGSGTLAGALDGMATNARSPKLEERPQGNNKFVIEIRSPAKRFHQVRRAGSPNGVNEMTIEREYVDHKHRHGMRKEGHRLTGLWWSIVLIWAGIVFGADSLGVLPSIGVGSAWSWIFTGAGLLGVLGATYRAKAHDVANPTAWDWVWGGFCLIVGLGGFTTLRISWPLILILVGGVLLASLFWRRDSGRSHR